jgi:hypothetical protein
MSRVVCFAALFALFFSSIALGQGVQATLTGRIVDSSGAVVPNVQVHVKNAETNQVVQAVSDAQGVYTAPFLRPGAYVVSVEASGFKKFTREGLVLNVGQTVNLDITLEVGSVTEQVTVTAETPLLETAKSDRGGVIDRERVHEFPLNGRNPFMLSVLVAGVNFNGAAIWQRPFDNGAIAEWTISGSTSRSTEFLLDGAPNNAQAGANNIAYVPPVDSVQEFKIQTNSYDAQYGHTGGGIVNVSLKSGTNKLHGTGYEFARRKAWDANSFQNNAAGVPRDEHYLDQFGWQVEGPIYLPKLYDGRNRSFFMFNYEGYREGTPRPATLSVPEPEMHNGDFSKLVDGQGRKITIYDPMSGRDVNGVWTRDPFAGNIIPAGRINPIAQKILSYQSKPNTKTPGERYAQYNYYFSGDPAVDADRFYNLVFKFDQQFGEKHRVFFRNASNDRTEMGYDSGNGIIGVGQYGALPEKRINDAWVLDWVGTINPTFIANVRGSFSRYLVEDRGDANKGFDMTSLGLPKSLVSQLPGGPFFGRYTFSNYQSMGQYFTGDITNTAALHPTITKMVSGHAIKAGFDMRWIQYITRNSGNPLLLSADRGWTQKEYNRSDALSGDDIASWLLGTPSSGSSDYNLFPTFLYRYYSPWVQDDWKVTRKLTLNLGFRWDFNIPANERYNRLNRSFDRNAANPVDKLIDRSKFPDLPTLKGSLLFAGVNGVPRDAANVFTKAIQPRAGFAYQLTAKLVVRGGWGRYYMNPSNDYLQTNGFSITTPLVTSTDGGRTPIPHLINNPFPSGIQLPPGASLGALSYLGRGFSFVNPDFKIPHINQFSFGLQYELPWQAKVEASYVGNRSKDMQSSKSINTYDLALRQKCNLAEGGNPYYCDERLPNPFYNVEVFRGTSTFSNSTLARSSYYIPYPHFGSLTELTRNDGLMWYNSMQITYEQRGRAGLNLIATYTLSKLLEQSGFLDVQRGIMQRSPYTWDRTHRFTLGSVYQLPVGRGKRFLNTTHPVWSRLISGWENTVMFTWQTGQPWNLPSGYYLKDARLPGGIDWSKPRVQAVRNCAAKWNDNGTITMQAYSVSAGCTDYNWLIAPRFAPRMDPNRDGRIRLHTAPQADVSLNKMTRITERVSAQFRAEAFNLTNTIMFYRQQYNNNLDSTSFGSITKAAVSFGNTNAPRYVQLGVKVIW